MNFSMEKLCINFDPRKRCVRCDAPLTASNYKGIPIAIRINKNRRILACIQCAFSVVIRKEKYVLANKDKIIEKFLTEQNLEATAQDLEEKPRSEAKIIRISHDDGKTWIDTPQLENMTVSD